MIYAVTLGFLMIGVILTIADLLSWRWVVKTRDCRIPLPPKFVDLMTCTNDPLLFNELKGRALDQLNFSVVKGHYIPHLNTIATLQGAMSIFAAIGATSAEPAAFTDPGKILLLFAPPLIYLLSTFWVLKLETDLKTKFVEYHFEAYAQHRHTLHPAPFQWTQRT